MGTIKREGEQIKEFDDVYYADVCTEGKIRIKKSSLYGEMDMDGNIIIEPQYERPESNLPLDSCLFFSEERASFYKDGKYGYLDKDGKEIISAKFDYAKIFHNGLAAVEENGKWGYIKPDGEYAIEPIYEWADNFFADVAQVKKNGEKLIIDKSGEILQHGISISEQCRTEENPQEGMLVVSNENGKYGYMNEKGEIIVEPQYTEAYPFSDGVALVLTPIKEGSAEAYYGYIGTDGQYVIEPVYYLAKNFNDGYAYVNHCKTQENIKGFIDKQGNLVTPKQIDASFEDSFKDGVTYVIDDEKGGEYIYPNGECAVSLLPISEQVGGLQYAQIGFKDGYAQVLGYEKNCLIDKEGKIILAPDTLYMDTNYAGTTGLVLTSDEEGLKGVKNLKNEWVIEPGVYGEIYILDKDVQVPEWILRE